MKCSFELLALFVGEFRGTPRPLVVVHDRFKRLVSESVEPLCEAMARCPRDPETLLYFSAIERSFKQCFEERSVPNDVKGHIGIGSRVHRFQPLSEIAAVSCVL